MGDLKVMEDLFRQFWWLLFPLFGTGVGEASEPLAMALGVAAVGLTAALFARRRTA